MADLDEELQTYLDEINAGKENFSEDEQGVIDGWIAKLSEPKDTDEDKAIRNEYARTLSKLVNEEKQLLPPFNDMPPEEDLAPLTGGGKQKISFSVRKMPCAKPRAGAATGAIPKIKKAERPPPEIEEELNPFEDAEEMAKAVARSKGQTFAEFVLSVSRHTADYGKGLRAAVKVETSAFRDYVDNVLSQRIKDLTEVLDEEQSRELQKIKKDIEKWQFELSNVKKRTKELVPEFDLEAYRKDRNYLRKLFAIDAPGAGLPEDDSFKRWKEESCHRLKWLSEMTCMTTRCNEQMCQEIAKIKSETASLEARECVKQQNYIKQINCEIAEYQKLKLERDRLHKEISDLLSNN